MMPGCKPTKRNFVTVCNISVLGIVTSIEFCFQINLNYYEKILLIALLFYCTWFKCSRVAVHF